MRKCVELSKEEIEGFIKDFYNYFETGFEFEEFLKEYLDKMGLDEVIVTQKTKDGGIDLLAKRYGVGGFSEVDAVEYYVQAKRYKPDKSITVNKIRELRGIIPTGHKGIFITTARFTKDAIKEAENDVHRPIILIDGEKLIESCIDNEVGFVFKPIFSKSAMDYLKEKNKVKLEKISPKIEVDKNISANDIRARILRIPRVIVGAIKPECEKLIVEFNGMEKKELTIDKTRTYLGGVTDLYKQAGLTSDDGSYKPCKATWKYYEDKIEIEIKEN